MRATQGRIGHVWGSYVHSSGDIPINIALFTPVAIMAHPNSEIDDLQMEIQGTLYTLTRDNLIELCNFLKISEDVKNKNRKAIVLYIIQRLEKDLEEAGSEEEDGGRALHRERAPAGLAGPVTI